MPRTYTITFKNVLIAAAQDLISAKSAAGKFFKPRKAWIDMNDATIQTAQGMQLNAKMTTGVLTLGSGGSVPTPRPYDPGDTAAGLTCHANDTTPATTSTSFVDCNPAGGHNFAGRELNWGDKGPIIGPTEGFVFEMLSTPVGTTHFSGGIEVEEVGG